MPPKRILGPKGKTSQSDSEAMPAQPRKAVGVARRCSETKDNLRKGVLSRNAAAAARNNATPKSAPVKPAPAARNPRGVSGDRRVEWDANSRYRPCGGANLVAS